MGSHKSHSKGAAAALQAARDVLEKPLEPLDCVQVAADERPFFDSIVRARARHTWTEHDLNVAANLAASMRDVERIRAELRAEGDVLINARGTPVANPKHSLLDVLSRRVMALSRMLHVHAEATVGKSEDATRKLALERQVRDDLERVSTPASPSRRKRTIDDAAPLIAMPRH